ncbi:MAG: hypothetical protein ACREEL_11905 [Stellaceae bacterium]
MMGLHLVKDDHDGHHRREHAYGNGGENEGEQAVPRPRRNCRPAASIVVALRIHTMTFRRAALLRRNAAPIAAIRKLNLRKIRPRAAARCESSRAGAQTDSIGRDHMPHKLTRSYRGL